ncbi:AAA family ATPase [Candidatus Enterococcus courvalinii]|uniref:Nuclease SbcCD subunit C n=1 Tax=Candidatus Enterococcus courvalinii TaxID=2815329 RepID=A0ABS3HWK4_9ENTE|nr:AAA family ATPase [Enterococcus sp. MSG2901]MBO0480845.1 AAA family ATPase [Enterococcus sp. MSG2901]
MKPQKLRLKNFGPFIDKTIDFSLLTEAPLFLISGKTGAGKTTIFDGMTYALFGETSGRLRSGKEMRSLFATPAEETSVTFSFEHQKLTYEVTRKPEQILAKLKGDGNRKQAAKVSLTIFDESGKEARQLTKRGEVDELIKELLHLDAKQFSQIVLLPQGEFRNFLISSSSEKEVVLRNLFGTQIFQQFNEILKEKAKKQQKTLDYLEQELLLLQKRFVSLEERDFSELSFEEVMQCWTKEQQVLAEKIELVQQQLRKEQDAQEKLEKEYYQIQSVQRQRAEKQTLLEKLENLLEMQDEITEKKQWIRYYEFGQRLIDPVSHNKEYENERQLLLEEESKQRLLLNKLQEEFTQWKEKAKERKTLQEAVELLNDDYQEKKALLPRVKEYTEQGKSLQVINAKLAGGTQKLADLQEQQNVLNKRQQEITQLLTTQEELAKQQLSFANLQQQKREWELAQQETQKLDQQKTQSQQQLVQLSSEVTEIKKERTKHQAKIAQLKSQWAKQQIVQLQLLLLPGEPCPVCGSVEHPLENISHEAPEKQAVQQLEKELADAEKHAESLNLLLGQKEAYLAKIEQQLEKEEKELANSLVKEANCEQTLSESFQDFSLIEDSSKITVTNEKVSGLFSEIEQKIIQEEQLLAKAKTEQVSLQAKLEKNRQAIEEQQEIQAELLANRQHRSGQMETLKQQLATVDINTLEEVVQQLAQQIEEQSKQLAQEKAAGEKINQSIALTQAQLSQLTEQLEKLVAKQMKTQAKIQGLLAEQAYFDSADAGVAFAQQQVEYEEYKTSVATYQEEQLITKAKLAQLESVDLSAEMPEDAHLAEQIAQGKQVIEEQQTALYKIQEQQENNQAIVMEFLALYQTSQEQLDELAQLQQLSQTINGENVKKISLERYVLQVYLQEVLQVANNHLQRLTKNRYQFELADSVGSYRGKTGLEINVYDDEAGMTRSAHTLSGGESFIAALSLALALAEVIQAQSGGITVEALFIDEGFGSLDEEALEMAMEALETIESEGRMIGIISHVRELKERVLQQIRIDAKGSGQSTVRYHLG